MSYVALVLVGDNRFKADVFHAPENILLNFGVFACEGADKLLDLLPLRARRVASSAVFGEFARALNKAQIVVVAPLDRKSVV